jgi:hypothetical protein
MKQSLAAHSTLRDGFLAPLGMAASTIKGRREFWGGFAAPELPPNPTHHSVIPNEAKRNEESFFYQTQSFVMRNLSFIKLNHYSYRSH